MHTILTTMLDAMADIVVVCHLGFVAFVVLGGLLVLRWPRVAWVHLPAAAWGAWVEVAGWVCPLTPLENWLRRRAGAEGYSSGFVEHYVVPILYPAALTREIQWLLGGLVIAINAAVYLVVLRHRWSRRAAKRAAKEVAVVTLMTAAWLAAGCEAQLGPTPIPGPGTSEAALASTVSGTVFEIGPGSQCHQGPFRRHR